MPFVKCLLKTNCPHHAQQHFKHLKGEDKFRCHAPAVFLKRRDKQHLVFDCVEDTVVGRLRGRR